MISSAFRIILFASLGHFCIDFMIGIWPVFKTIAGLDLAKASILAAVCVFTGESLQMFVGSLCDRGYARYLIATGVTIATTSLLFPFVSTYAAFFLLYMGTCLGSSAFHPTAASLLSGLDVVRKNCVMGVFSASGMLGFGLSQITFSWTLQECGGNTHLLAVVPFMLAIACFFLLPKQKAVASTEKKEYSFKLILSFFKNKTLLALFITLLANQIILFSMLFLLPDYLSSLQISSWIALGGGTLFFMAGASLSPPLLGYLADRSSVRNVLVIVSSLSFATYLVLLLSHGLSEEMVLGLLFSMGALLGGVSALVWSFGAQVVPEHRGMVSAFLMGYVWIFAEAGGIGLSGVLADLFAEDGPRKALLSLAAAGLFAIFYASKIPVRLPQPDEA